MAQEVIQNTVPTEVIPADILHPTWQQEDVQDRESAKQLLFLVFKWKWLILSVAAVFTIAAAVAMSLRPLVRTATAKILFKADRIPLQMAELSTSKMPYSLQVLESETKMLTSRGVLFPAAKQLLSQNGNQEEGVSEDEIDSLANSMEERLSAISLPDTNIIQVNYNARTAEEAVQALSAILEHYQEQHAVAHGGSTELLKFYEQERDRAGVDLKTAEDQLANWQATNNVVLIDDQLKGLLEMKADQETALQRVEAEMAKSPEGNPLIAKLKGDLVSAEIELHDLLQRYTEEDRRVQEKREKIALLKKELADAERTFQGSLAAQRDTLRKQIREISATLTSLREKKLDIDRLSRLVNLHQDTFLLYGKKVEEARIAAGLDKEQLSNIAMIEPPHALPSTDLKRRLVTVFLAGIVGLALGIAIALGLALFNSSLRMEEDIELYLKLPVLAVIPDLQLQRSAPL
jgi:uncharacterized protein involved in exopolysaccharide biosynthesis